MAFDLFWIYFVILVGGLLYLNVKYYTIQENILWFVLPLYHNVVYCIVIIKQQVIIEPAATDKRRKTMKTKIQFTDSYSGRAINIVINLTDGEKEYYLREDDKNVIYNKMSSYQRAKIESFFGKMNAYYTKIEIL